MVAAVTATAAALGLQESVKSKPDDPNGPTPVREGVKTERQKQHGRLFPYRMRKLRDLAGKQSGDIEVVMHADIMRTVDPNAPKVPAMRFAVCNADAVFIGTLKSKSSQLTDDESFIFTDYDMVVEQVIKDNPSAPAQAGAELTMTREGGEIQLNGRTFRARRDDFKAVEVGKRHLLFLRYLPETGAYLAYPNGSFELDGDKVVALGGTSREELLDRGAKNLPTLLGEVHAATAAGCQKP
ncbi:MAG TPA: hypothetical protein VN282_01040 [Pyrinomonadaceae bacterium]|nr:hypothetical protein [Pyrinomonadaceae bacterium]